MRVLFTTLPGAGPFHPLVPLARAAADAGHVVAFATAASYCPTVERGGFRCFPAGVDHLVADLGPIYAQIRGEMAGNGIAFSPLRDVFGAYLPARMVPDLEEIVHTWSPDVLVRDPMEFAGCVAAEHLGIPHTACGPLFMFWQGAWHHTSGEVAKPNLDALRAQYGLPPDPNLTALHRHLYLACLPPTFLGPDLAIPPTVQFLRPVSFNQSGDEHLPDRLQHLPDRPTVHASLGTIFHHTPGVFPAILDALRDEPINLILAVGRDQDPAQFGPQPPNVAIERYIPHTELLPHCDALITHGGFSSVMVGLEHGLPMVLIPLAGGDQGGNAQRCAALGVGRVISAERRTPEAIRDAVRQVLAIPTYRNNAEHIRDAMRELPGPDYGVTLLARLADAKQPSLAPPRIAGP